jgi:hypothetical protein
MMPSAFVELAALPLTPNGKIDRRALGALGAPAAPPAADDGGPVVRDAPAAAVPAAPAAGAAPAGALEAMVADVWRGLLGADRVAVDGNIFDLGANSLLAVQASRRLAEALGRPVPLVAMFQYPTVRRLAAHLAAADGGAGERGAAAGDAAGDGAGRDRAGRRTDARMDAMERRRMARTRLGAE